MPVSDRRYYPVYQTCIDLDIPIVSETEGRPVQALSSYSPIVAKLEPTKRIMLYTRPEWARAARARVRKLVG